MKQPSVIMFDIDGVLADFVLGFTALASEKFYISPRMTYTVKTWSFEDFMTKLEVKDTLDKVARSSTFWRDLPVMSDVTPEDLGRIQRLNENHRVYFVTSRLESGNTIQQTRHWLFRLGITPPNVIISKKKGEIARALAANFSIDDKWDNAHCIHWISDRPQTVSYLINRPYNHVPNKIGAEAVRRVSTVKQFLDDVERAL